jgi:uncharacterized protein with NRDE domain
MKKEKPNFIEMMEWMQDSEPAADKELPSTGVSAEWEKQLSSMCIQTENYGTCCTTVVAIGNDGRVEYHEKTFPKGNRKPGTVSIKFTL